MLPTNAKYLSNNNQIISWSTLRAVHRQGLAPAWPAGVWLALSSSIVRANRVPSDTQGPPGVNFNPLGTKPALPPPEESRSIPARDTDRRTTNTKLHVWALLRECQALKTWYFSLSHFLTFPWYYSNSTDGERKAWWWSSLLWPHSSQEADKDSYLICISRIKLSTKLC